MAMMNSKLPDPQQLKLERLAFKAQLPATDWERQGKDLAPSKLD